jgi:hypothetical protein
MKAPVVLVAAALMMAILLAASFLIATGTRGENALRLHHVPFRYHLMQKKAEAAPVRLIDL